MNNKIETSVIGSYPVQIDRLSLMNSYFNQSISSWNEYISQAVNDMISAGITIISDGQTRDPFVNIFIRKLRGCRIRYRAEVIDKIEYDGPIIIDDQKYVRTLIPNTKKIVGPITGPYTLMRSCSDLFYNDEKQLAFDLANALNKEMINLQKHVDLISIDEPFFSVNIPDYGKDLMSVLLKDVKCSTRLHVCGDVSEIIPNILDMPVDILSHEFKALPKLIDKFKDYYISKKICLGCVRSDKDSIETVEEITSHLKKGLNIFNDKIVQISPDCGQRMLPQKIAFQKLRNLSLAGEKLNG
jgi:5-methyltetrahydropteroyltriglutamate--homocysteine methyltransferase